MLGCSCLVPVLYSKCIGEVLVPHLCFARGFALVLNDCCSGIVRVIYWYCTSAAQVSHDIVRAFSGVVKALCRQLVRRPGAVSCYLTAVVGNRLCGAAGVRRPSQEGTTTELHVYGRVWDCAAEGFKTVYFPMWRGALSYASDALRKSSAKAFLACGGLCHPHALVAASAASPQT